MPVSFVCRRTSWLQSSLGMRGEEKQQVNGKKEKKSYRGRWKVTSSENASLSHLPRRLEPHIRLSHTLKLWFIGNRFSLRKHNYVVWESLNTSSLPREFFFFSSPQLNYIFCTGVSKEVKLRAKAETDSKDTTITVGEGGGGGERGRQAYGKIKGWATSSAANRLHSSIHLSIFYIYLAQHTCIPSCSCGLSPWHCTTLLARLVYSCYYQDLQFHCSTPQGVFDLMCVALLV